jgi:hypothetical protein
MMLLFKHSFLLLVGAVIGATALASSDPAQRRDYMTDDEIELVRDAQDIDLRIDVLIKMIDRRFAVLKVNVGGAAIPNKEADKWGPAPTGSRTDLLDDIRKLLDKAIDDVDNVAMHPVKFDIDKTRSEKQKKKDENRFPGSVRNLAAAAKRYQPGLKSLLDSSTDEKDRGVIMGSLESCDEIIEAATTKLPAEIKDDQ